MIYFSSFYRYSVYNTLIVLFFFIYNSVTSRPICNILYNVSAIFWYVSWPSSQPFMKKSLNTFFFSSKLESFRIRIIIVTEQIWQHCTVVKEVCCWLMVCDWSKKRHLFVRTTVKNKSLRHCCQILFGVRSTDYLHYYTVWKI